MAYPSTERIESPILHELVATGGAEDVRYLYARLVAYFPQLTKSLLYRLGTLILFLNSAFGLTFNSGESRFD